MADQTPRIKPSLSATGSLAPQYFERLYAESADPWDFEASPYETAKYAATLAALPRPRYANALELGCSIGVLTRQLAPRCERLLATAKEMPRGLAWPTPMEAKAPLTGFSHGTAGIAWALLELAVLTGDDRFRAAALQKPVINWVSKILNTDISAYQYEYTYGKQPWDNPDVLWKNSPLSLVGNVKTPTLIVVGEKDYRTPVSESEQYYGALQLRGIPSSLAIVPGASHGGLTARPSQSAAKASAIIVWFDRYRNPPVAAAKP